MFLTKKFFITIIILLFLVLALLIKKISPNFLYKSFDEYHNINKKNVYIVIDDNYDFKNPAKFIDKQIYIPFDFIRSHIDKYIFLDKNKNKIIITDKTKVIRLKINKLDYYLNNKAYVLEHPIKKIKSNIYLPADFLAKNYNLNIRAAQKYNLIIIDFNNKSYDQAKVKKNSVIRYKPNKKSFIAQKISKNQVIKVYNKKNNALDNNYKKIRTQDGLIGYIKSKKIIDQKKVMPDKKLDSKSKINDNDDNNYYSNTKIKMLWDNLSNQTANYYATQKEFDKSINIISPTWFYFDTNKLNGDIISLISQDYINKAHENNIKVWPVLSDELNYNTNHAIISDSDKREHVINQLINFIDLYNLDGINIDFEGVRKYDADCYIQFLRELAPLLKSKNIILSVDIFVPQAWSMYYNRKEIANIANYVCLMAYDEYNSSSDQAGPVASYDFVFNAIKNTLKEVPDKKIILGVPFYTRFWIENNNKLAIQNVSCQKALDFFNKNNIKLKWLDDKKYYYGEYKTLKDSQEIIYKSWIEDKFSIRTKLELINKFNLAGIACWNRFFGTKDFFDLINNYLD